jgi:hypothetical protein
MLSPQQESGAFPGSNFVDAVKDSILAAPSASHVEKKRCKKAVKADRVEDSKEGEYSDFLKEIEKAFPTEPLDNHPPLNLRKNRLANYRLKEL